MKTNIILLMLFFANIGFRVDVGQLKTVDQGDTIVFTRLKAAVKQPKMVYKLDLSGQNLKLFPKEILTFRNLVELNIGVKEIYDKKKKTSKRKYAPNHVDSYGWLFKKIKKNEIDLIPDEIAQLDNLRLLNITGNNISKENLARLKELLPNCLIIF